MHDKHGVLIQKTQINLSRPTALRMWLVFSAAALVVIQSALSDGGVSLVVALTALCAGLIAELLITGAKNGFSKLKDGSTAASVLVFALLLPNQIHPVYAAIGALFAIAVVKYSFGGLGANWLNPALGGWLLVRLAWPGAFAAALENSPLSIIAAGIRDGLVHDAPMDILGMSAENSAGSPVDAAVSSFLNRTVFLASGAELPPRYIDLLFCRSPGIIADRGILAILAGSIVISAFSISRTWVTTLFLGIFGLLTWYAGDLPFEGLFWNGDVLFAFFSGGTLVTAFILAVDPASAAKSKIGALFTAALGAVFAWLFRFRGLEFYGCFTALALMNALTPAIRFFERRLLFSYKRKNAGEVST